MMWQQVICVKDDESGMTGKDTHAVENITIASPRAFFFLILICN
jgi:hypothetical protein